MKRVLPALLALAMVALGCNSGGAAALALGPAPWQDGGQALYDVLDRQGTRLGSEEILFAKDGEAWVLTVADKIPPLEQTSKVRIDAATLKPLGGDKTIRSQGTDVTIKTAYAGGKLQIDAVVNGENRSANTAVPANALDNDQLLMTLRAAPFAEGYRARLVTVVPGNATKVNTTVTVKGKETVQVPAGSFEAWRVELDFGQVKQSAWYQVEAPHEMVQYDNGATRLVLASAR